MALDVGNKNSAKRNQAFEILKNITAAIGHSRSWSASSFRGMTRTRAAQKRHEVAVAMRAFASANGVSLTNRGDPLANYTTAETNLEKLRVVEPDLWEQQIYDEETGENGANGTNEANGNGEGAVDGTWDEGDTQGWGTGDSWAGDDPAGLWMKVGIGAAVVVGSVVAIRALRTPQGLEG